MIKLFVTRKWIEVNNLSGGQYSIHKNIRFKTPMLRSNLCDYSDAYIVVKRKAGLLAVTSNNAPFRSSISKINNTIDNAEDLDIVMSMYNLLEQSQNYSMKSGSSQIIQMKSMMLMFMMSFECTTQKVGDTPERS